MDANKRPTDAQMALLAACETYGSVGSMSRNRISIDICVRCGWLERGEVVGRFKITPKGSLVYKRHASPVRTFLAAAERDEAEDMHKRYREEQALDTRDPWEQALEGRVRRRF